MSRHIYDAQVLLVRKSSMFKSQLQEYVQKAGWMPPFYQHEQEGPPHELCFRASVTLQGVTYKSPKAFGNLKQAEHAAAEVALRSIAQTSKGVGKSLPVLESGLCKNILQNYTQNLNLPPPKYHLEKTGEPHIPVFVASVEVGGIIYFGHAATKKKEAEIKAAKTAILTIHAGTRMLEECWNNVTAQSHTGPKRKSGNRFTGRKKSVKSKKWRR